MFQQELLYDWQAHAGEVYGVQFSSDETALYSMGKDNLFCQWSVIQSGAKVVEFKVHEGACSPTAEWLIASEGRFYPRTPRGNLFAFESEDRFVLTCSAQEAVVYQVRPGRRGDTHTHSRTHAYTTHGIIITCMHTHTLGHTRTHAH